MSRYVANPAHGPQRYASWKCADCPAESPGNPEGADYDSLRALAVLHLEANGHRVSIARGTLEVLYPLATIATTELGI